MKAKPKKKIKVTKKPKSSINDEKPKRKSKAAIDKLGGRPFKTIGEYNLFKEEIHRSVLKQLEIARAMEEYTKLTDYKFFRENFSKGMHCAYGSGNDDIVHVFMDDDGIQIKVCDDLPNHPQSEKELVGILVKAMSESLVGSYYKSLGYLPSDAATQEEISSMLHKKK